MVLPCRGESVGSQEDRFSGWTDLDANNSAPQAVANPGKTKA
jgi:hypothetical protein